jgi:diguanylate cyclase (GGDEF)-like protein/PAS domain S-box-containing protein
MMPNLQNQNRSAFGWILLAYTLLVWVFFGQGDAKFESLHLLLDTSNGLLSLLLAFFFMAEQNSITSRVRTFLVIGFSAAAFTEILHALVGIEWTGSLSWIETSSKTLRPATWPPSTYALPFALAWALWLKRHQSELSTRWFVSGLVIATTFFYTVAYLLPKYFDTGILGIQRPTQAPLLILWSLVIGQCWKIRHEHPLFEGLIGMGALLIASDLFMLYSTSPHEKFTMMAHSGKLFAYLWMHFMLMRLAAEDNRARHDAERALSVKATQLQASLDEVQNLHFAMDQHSIVGITDVTGTITYANDIFCQVSGYSREELIGQNHRILNSGKHSPEFFKDLYSCITKNRVWHGEICNRRKNGELYWVKTTIVPFQDKAGKPREYISMRTDITERKLAEEKLLGMALYDNLTKLPNRRLLHERLEQAMESGLRSQRYGALLFLDLDHFKPLNDMHGHHVGDALLEEVARRIKNSVRAMDTAARFGGDEFIVLLGELDADEAESTQLATVIAEKIRHALAEPYLITVKHSDGTLKTIEHHCSACIGVTLFHGKLHTADEILQMADVAMYHAKDRGPNAVNFYADFA